MITIYFTEFNTEFNAPMNVGEVNAETSNIEKAREKATKYVDILTQVRGTKVSYMLGRGNSILVNI